MSRSRTSSPRHTDDSSLDQRGSKPSQKTTSPQMPRTTSRAPDDANASTHTLVNPPERATKPQHGEPATSRAALPAAHRQAAHHTTGTPQARARLEKKLKRLEPPARSDASMPHAHMDQAEQHHGRETGAEQHDTAKPTREHEESTITHTPLHVQGQSKDAAKKSPRLSRSRSSPARKAVFCGNNKLDKKLRVNGGHLEIGSPHACFMRGVGGGIHQEILPSDEDTFVEKWNQPYEKLVSQPIYYKAGPVPQGMIRCTLPQSLARGFAVGSIQRAKKILKQRGHTTHGA